MVLDNIPMAFQGQGDGRGEGKSVGKKALITGRDILSEHPQARIQIRDLTVRQVIGPLAQAATWDRAARKEWPRWV